jgi:hypothetical protein
MKLNQIIAIEKGVKARAQETLDVLYKVVQKPALFEGMTRVYRPKNDEGDKLPGERKVVQYRVDDALSTIRLAETEAINVTAQKEQANTVAAAPVLVDGKLVIGKVPATTLLFLERRLTNLRTFLEALPELDIGEEWEPDYDSGLSRTAPVETQRTVKLQRPLVLFPATDKHPAQTQVVTEDVLAGFWNTTRQSGAIAKTRKLELIDRVDKLLIGVKEAREEANSVDAGERANIGGAIFEFLLK